MDKVQSALSAQILKDKHVTDWSLDNQIDFNTQYVKLKLQSHTSIRSMQMDDIERPDYYQDSLKQQGGTEIEDEGLIKGNDFEKYVLLRGRAGIGKSTLMQRLLWKWANGEWATQFKAIFLFNLRYLMTIKKEVDFSIMINRYSVYNAERSEFTPDIKWLTENQMKIAFVLDGVDEVRDFKEYWRQTNETSSTLQPIHWCFTLMRRELFNKATLIVSSRPFADLGSIGKTLKDKTLSNSLQLVQLMGLTRERVHEFVKKNVQEPRKGFVWQTLVKNPILMSISSITFYCAALCKILEDQTDAPPPYTTYTQITMFIMDKFIQRSLEKVEETFDVKEVLQFLSKLACNGLVKEIGKGPLRLVFGSKDFEELTTKKNITSLMTKSGLLMQTEVLDPDDKEKCTVLSQFVHLMIQELLAMAGILSQSMDEFRQLIEKLSGTQQFSMATLFLYGLVFDRENDLLQKIGISDYNEGEMLEKQQAMILLTGNMTNKFQALQVAHESRSPEVARAVGENVFKDGCHIENTKLTVIDIMALTFVLKHNPAITEIRLERGELDVISLKEIAKFLKEENHIRDMGLVDGSLDDACVRDLMLALRKNTSLKTLELSLDSMTDTGMESVADTLNVNESLSALHLSAFAVTDKGIQHIAKSLESNKTLETLGLVFRGMTDEGLQHLVASLQQNSTLKELSMIDPSLTDAGISALGQFLSNSSIQSLRVDCSGMTDEGVQRIADSLVENKTLRKLRLHSRRVTDAGVKYLMDKLTKQSTLTDMMLFGFTMKEDAVKAVLNTLSVVQTLSIKMKKPNVSSPLLLQVQGNNRIELR